MALMLAPYNEAMRLGMGFNSYTQQLCCNDIVRLPNGRPATMQELQDYNPKPPQGAPVATSGAQSAILSSAEGTDMIKQRKIGIGNDNQNEVSQVVSWKASFVDKVSDVTKNLNISGALKVKVDAIGEVEVSGHYIDDKSIKTSDATYDILVKVTNQRLEAPQVNKFCPIENLDRSRFNEVYGDCFISGFLEGGLFHGLVSIKKKDDVSKLDAGGKIKAGAKVSGFDITGEIEAGFKTGKTDKDYNTTVTVNWAGGGDIKPNEITEWNLANLTKAAMDFPDKVAACPQFTYAILTKYSSLRSFHEATVKGSPLDYENAGIYTNSLLDSYMDYKYIWSQIQERIAAVDKGLMRVEQLEAHPHLAAYRQEFIKSYEDRMNFYHEAQKTLELVKKRKPDTDIVIDPPMKPNALEPYSPDLFGLDAAKRDCRFEMIKIVKEVNAVGNDPKVAIDATRIWQYVAPSIFRRLVPADKPVDEKTGDGVKAIKADVEERIRTAASEVRDNATIVPEEPFLLSGQPVCELEKRVCLRYGHLVEDWRIDSINGQSAPATSCQPFNDLEVLDKTYVVTNITVWHDKKRLVGIQLLYQNGQTILHGVKDSEYQFETFNIDSNRKRDPERVNLVWLEAHEDDNGNSWVDSIRVSTTGDLLIVEPVDRPVFNKPFKLKSSRPRTSDTWDLKGFYGSFDPEKKAFAQLSPIWGQAPIDALGSKTIPLFEDAAWPTVLTWPSFVSESLRNYLNWGSMYRFSAPCGDLANTKGKPFNALDHITLAWVVKKVFFYFTTVSNTSVLSGVAVEYTNDKQLQHGKCASGMLVQIWEPPSKENQRISGVSTCTLQRPGAASCSLGFRVFVETEEEVEVKEEAAPKKSLEEPVDRSVDKSVEKSAEKSVEKSVEKSIEKSVGTTAEKNVEKPAEAAASTPAATSESKTDSKSEAAKGGAQAEDKKAPNKEAEKKKEIKKEKIIKKTDIWLTGPIAMREDPSWSEENASWSPALKGSAGEKWTIKGFMGQAGTDGIETISVLWAKN